MKKPVRILLLLLGASAMLVAVLVGLAFTPAVQTWAVRRAVANVPGAKIEIGRAAIGLHAVHLENIRVTQSGLVLTLPAADVELPVLAAARGQIDIARLTAKGWTVDLTSTPAAPANTTPATAFDGIFKRLKLPFALSLTTAEIEGDVIQAGGHTHLTVSGGGLGSGKEAIFKITTRHEASTADAPVKTAAANAELLIRMDAPDAIQSFALNADAIASGPKFPDGTKTHLTVRAGRDATGESYTAIVSSGSRELVNVEAQLPADGQPFTGKWMLDASDADLVPFRQFLAGMPLPVFQAKGQGTLRLSRDFKEITAVGKLDGHVEKLEALRPELTGVLGQMDFTTDFDLRSRGDLVSVTRLSVRIGAAQPVIILEALQGFEFNRDKLSVTAANPAVALARIELKDLPLAWAQPWVKDLKISQGRVNGLIEAGTRDGGVVTLNVKALDVAGVVTQEGQTLWQGSITLPAAAAEYSKEGWRATVPAVTVTAPPPTVAGLTLRGVQISQGSAAREPLKVTGLAEMPNLALLPALSPVFGAQVPVSAGLANLSFTASLGDKKEIAAKLAVSGLVAAPTKQALPDATLDLRADIAADGSIALNAPVTVTRGTQKSDLTLGGKFTPTNAGGWQIDAQAVGDLLYAQDIGAFADLKPGTAPVSAPSTPPPWAGVKGTVKFAFKKIVFSPDRASSFAGTMFFDGSGPQVEAHGTLDGTPASPFVLKGGLTHTPGTATPYAFMTDATLTDFTLAALQHTLEANVNLTVSLTGRAASIDALIAQTQGKIQFTSKGGVTRLLAASDGKPSVAGTGAAIVGTVAGLLGGVSSTAGNVAKVITRISDLLHEIHFDQLSVTLSRGATNDLVLEELTLIAPEVRLAGHGRVRHVEGKELAALPLTLQFQVAARGNLGDAMKSIGLVSAQPDSLGYFPLAVDLPELGGTLGAPDTTAFYGRLTERAVIGGVGAATKGAGSLLQQGASGLLKGVLGQ